MKKIYIVLAAAIVAVFALVLTGFINQKKLENEKNQSGILLAFDDYNEQNWESYFDLFDQYDVRVTFFVNAYYPTEFCLRAIECGHEIGFHTLGHANLREVTKEEFIVQAIDPIEVFKEHGVELTSFAYPYGAYEAWMNEELLEHYDVVRGAYYYQLYNKSEFQKEFVESKPIDNYYYATDEAFQEDITQMLTEASQNEGTIVSLYSHAIDGGDWCVSAERLEYIFQKAKELNLKFYIYKDLQ